MTEVEIYLNIDNTKLFSEERDAHRTFALWYWTECQGEAAAEEAFHISNAPESLLSQSQLEILSTRWKSHRALSVGDAVLVRTKGYGSYMDKQFLCCGCGWKEI